MRLTRVYTDTLIKLDEALDLPQDASHHLGRVLRLRPDHNIQVFNGRGGYYTARIMAVGKRGVTVLPLEHVVEERESSLLITLGQGISRGQRMDYTIQKAVELGVSSIVPLVTEFSNVRLDEERSSKRQTHWQSIVIHACEQCGRTRLPEVAAPRPFGEWFGSAAAGHKLMLAPAAGKTLKQLAPQQSCVLLAGPEGGFSEGEAAAAIAAGYEVVTLGPRVLRTETAAVAALAAIQALWGDLG